MVTRFVFSHAPKQAMCRISDTWSLEAIVNGSLIVCASGSREDVFESRIPVEDLTFLSSKDAFDRSSASIELLSSIPVVAIMLKPLAIASALAKIKHQDFFCWEFTELLYLRRNLEQFTITKTFYRRAKDSHQDPDIRMSSYLIGSSDLEGPMLFTGKKGRFLAKEAGRHGGIMEEDSTTASLMDDSVAIKSDANDEALEGQNIPQKQMPSRGLLRERVRNAMKKAYNQPTKQPNQIKYISQTTMLKKDNPTVVRRPVKHHAFTAVYDDKLKQSLQKVVVSRDAQRSSIRDGRLDRLRGIHFESSLGGTHHNKEEGPLRVKSRELPTHSRHLTPHDDRRLPADSGQDQGAKYTYQPTQTPSNDPRMRVPTADRSNLYETRSQSGRVSIELRSVQQYSVEIRVRVTEGDCVITAVLPASEGPPSPQELAERDETIALKGGFISMQDLPRNSKRPITITFTDLRPSFAYKAYVCVRYMDALSEDVIYSSEEQVLATSVEFNTLVENYDIDWTAMSEYMKEQEILAACQDVIVQRFAIAARVLIPPATKIRPSLVKPGADFAVDAFISWWWGNRRGFVSKHRHDFLDREVEFVLKSNFFRNKVIDEGVLTSEEYQHLASAFENERNVEWLRFQHLVYNRSYLSFTADNRGRNDVMEKSLSYSQDHNVVKEEDGLEAEAGVTMEKASPSENSTFQDDKSKVEVSAETSRKILEHLYFKFRSWYKGGFEAFQAKRRLADETSVPASSASKERMIDRTALLAERVAMLKQCDERIHSLVESYRYDRSNDLHI